MSTAASPPGRKIDIAASVQSAYTVVFGNPRLVAALAWLPFAILVGIEIAAWLLRGGRLGDMVASLIRAAGLVVFDTVFDVRWYRFVLLGETIPDGFFPPGWGTFLLATVKLGLLFLLGVVALAVIAAFTPDFLGWGIIIGGMIALGLVSIRMLLAFPAAAIKRPISLVGEAWDLLGGNYWRLVVCLIACGVPFAVVDYILDQIDNVLPPIMGIVVKVVSLAVSFAASAVITSLLSEVYRRLYPSAAGPVVSG